MKKTILAAALVAVAGGAQAATTHTMTDGRFDFVDASGALTSSGHDDVQGAFDLAGGTGSFTTSTAFNGYTWTADVAEMDFHSSFMGGTSTAGEANTFEWTTNTMWDGVNPFASVQCRVSTNVNGCADLEAAGWLVGASSTSNYSYTLQEGQFAAGVFFDWSVNEDIPVLAIMQVVGFNPDGSMDVVSVDLDGNISGMGSGNCGTFDLCGVAMVTSPFPSQTPIFSGTIVPVSTGAAPVPVPAAVWLFGSGLLGLAGVARRRKAA